MQRGAQVAVGQGKAAGQDPVASPDLSPADPVDATSGTDSPAEAHSEGGTAPPVTDPLDPVAAQAAQGVPQPLLYYAVWLPAPQGQMAGPPIYIPAATPGAGWPVPTPPASLPPVPPPVPSFAPPPPPQPAATGPTPLPPVSTAEAHNQKLLVTGIIFFVFLVHLPWLVYLFGVHGCWGSFWENCFAEPAEADVFSDVAGQPMLFARVTFLMLRVQSVLAGDWAQFSQAMQISTGVGSFVLTKIVAANGLIAEGRMRVWLLALTCALAFAVLFWAELHLAGTVAYPELGDETVLAYIDQTLPPDFVAFSTVESSLTEYLQFLRLADALILGAALAMPTTKRTAA